jgi:TM2 domain-containing membrane protein YozV
VTKWQSWEQRQQQPAVPPQFDRQYQQPPQYQQPRQLQHYRPPQQYQQPAQYGYQPPRYAPQVPPKSTGIALLLGLLFPGVGCMYAGRIGVGAAILVAWLVSIPLVFVAGIGFFTGLAAWILSAVLGYTFARDYNTARGFMS